MIPVSCQGSTRIKPFRSSQTLHACNLALSRNVSNLTLSRNVSRSCPFQKPALLCANASESDRIQGMPDTGARSALSKARASVKRAIRDLEKQIDRERSSLDPEDKLGLNSSHLASIKAKTQLRDELEAGLALDADSPAGFADDLAVCKGLLGHDLLSEPPPKSLQDFEKFLATPVRLPVGRSVMAHIQAECPRWSNMLYYPGESELVIEFSVMANGNLIRLAEYSKIFMSHWVVSSITLLKALDESAPDTARLNFTPISIDAERGRSYFATQAPVLPMEAKAQGKLPRVDKVLCVGSLFLALGIDRVLERDGLSAAWKELETELQYGFSTTIYGQIPFLIVWAAAGTSIQFGILHKDGKVERASEIYDISKMDKRIMYCIALVNIYKLLVLFVKLAPPSEERTMGLVEVFEPEATH